MLFVSLLSCRKFDALTPITRCRPLRIIAILLCLLVTVNGEEYELNNGRKIPALGLGTAKVSNVRILYCAPPSTRYIVCVHRLLQAVGLQEVVKTAVDMGYRLIDTASLYKNEAVIGKGLKEVFQGNKTRREDLFIVSKVSYRAQSNPW